MKAFICTFCYSSSKCKQDLVWGIRNISDYLLGYDKSFVWNGIRFFGEFWGLFFLLVILCNLFFIFLIGSYFKMCYTSSFSKPSRKAAFHQIMQNRSWTFCIMQTHLSCKHFASWKPFASCKHIYLKCAVTVVLINSPYMVIRDHGKFFQLMKGQANHPAVK